jgi:hypothetical protein
MVSKPPALKEMTKREKQVREEVPLREARHRVLT